MRHRRDIRLAAALVGLALACAIPAQAADPLIKRIETEQRRIPGENQGQAGFWLEHEEYAYRYDPWPEKVVQTYQDLFGKGVGRAGLDPLIGRIHRKELTLEAVLTAIRALKGALDAVDNNPMWHWSDVNPTFSSQSLDFALLDKHFGKAWHGQHEDKRPILQALYASDKTMDQTYGSWNSVHDIKHPITTSAFVELTRLARIIEAMDLEIPLPVREMRGEYLTKKGTSGAEGDRYRLALNRRDLVTKMQQIYQMAVNTNSKQRHSTSGDGSNVNWNKAPLY